MHTQQFGVLLIQKKIGKKGKYNYFAYRSDRNVLSELSWLQDTRDPLGHVANTVMLQLIDSPMHIAWIGQCARRDPNFKTSAFRGKNSYRSLYHMVWPDENDWIISPPPKVERLHGINLFAKNPWDGWYLINESKKLYIDMGLFFERNRYEPTRDCTPHYPINTNQCRHPLPLLTAVGNSIFYDGSYSGGLTASGIEDIGTWAFDLLRVSKDRPGQEYACETNYEFRDWEALPSGVDTTPF